MDKNIYTYLKSVIWYPLVLLVQESLNSLEEIMVDWIADMLPNFLPN